MIINITFIITETYLTKILIILMCVIDVIEIFFHFQN